MQQGRQMLAKHGIDARPIRPPLGLTSGSCGYGLMVTESDAHRTVKLLAGHRIDYGKTFLKDADRYREVLYGLPG